jgi:hypothetical protein
MRGIQTFRLFRAALAAAIVLAATKADAGSWPQITLVRRLSGLANPVHVTNAGDRSGRLFVVEQRGRIRIVKGGALLPTPFLDISERVSCCGERGLLSVAFPPGFTGGGVFYVDYTDTNGDTAISRFSVSFSTPDVADAGSEQVILHVAQPYPNHNGGQLAFGPDGYLYIGMGDGGSGGDPQNHAQNPASLLGKILRIDVTSGAPTYVVPPSNPFVGRPGWRPEIWALGLRNPWRFSFDRKTEDLYIADVGQNSREEVDFQPASSPGGENYGWRIMEGTACYNAPSCDPTGLVLPVADYTHTGGDCSVTGGFVYRGLSCSALQGIYFYADFCTGRIRGLRRTATGWETHELLDAGFTISTFGEDERGEIYLVDYGGGVLYEVVDAAGPSSVLTVPVVVDAAGEGGAQFASELTLANRGTTSVSLELTYTPSNALGSPGGGTVPEALGAGRQTTIPDAIAYLRQKGLPIPTSGQQAGTLRIRATGASSGDVVYASVRTTAPSGAGRAGLAYAAVNSNETAESPISLFGLREDAAFRSNLAFLDAGDPADSTGILLRVTLRSGNPGDARTAVLPSVSLGPGQWLQLNHVLSQAGMTNGWATIERVGGVDPYYAYAVVNDNVTNDGSFIPPVALRKGVNYLMLPVAAKAAGYSTECVVVNPGTDSLTFQIGSSRLVTLQPGEQRFIPDLFSFIGYQLGQPPIPVPIWVRNATPESTFLAGARTFAAAPGGGSYGLFYPALPQTAAGTDEAWVYGLRQDGGARSNLAFVNWTGNYGSPDGIPRYYTLFADVFDGETGLLAGSASVSLNWVNPDWRQINSILSPFGVRNGYVRVRGSGTPSQFLVYGVVNDGATPGEGTSDGSYLPMVVPLPPSPFPK